MIKIQNISVNMKYRNVLNNQQTQSTQKNEDKTELIMKTLNSLAATNAVSFSGKKENFQINLTTEELKKRTNKEYLKEKKLLGVNSIEYTSLAEGDKKALKHLVKAAKILEEVFLKQDNEKNIEFRTFLRREAKKGNKDARMALKLFNAQKGIIAVDSEAKFVVLAKGEKEIPQKAFYPKDLKKQEFHRILTKMLNEGKTEEVKEILNTRSVIIRNGKHLKSIDFTQKYEKEFKKAAEEIEKAADFSTNEDFNEYLRLQAVALRKNDPMLDAYADKKWAELQDTPLEFTISREQYADEMTGTVVENEELKQLLKKHNIEPISKDSIGVRVGIINKEGTEKLLGIKKYLPMLAENMPFNSEYEQSITNDAKQTMVDADIVTLAGDEGAYRGGVTLAQNLPNIDKLSFTIGGGRRNVYHRQIRQISDYKKLQKMLDAVLVPDLHKYYDAEADHWFTIGHENAHSLGPKKGTEALGKYQGIIEENKADIASIAMVEILKEQGFYTEEQKNKILTTFAVDIFLKAKPNLSQAHRVRSVMQANYFMKNGAIEVDKQGFVHVNIEKMVPTAKKMLNEIIRVQLSKDFSKGEKYVLDNFVWTKEMEKVAKKLKKIDKTLNGIVKTPLADKLLREK